MARLPVPGSDNGTWGDILNAYLQVAHDTSGALKADAVSASAVQDNSITDNKLMSGSGSDGQVLTKNSGLTGGFEWTSVAGSPDATTSTKGLIRLAGDLGGSGTAAAAPVISNGAITTAKLATGAVTTNEIADATITNTDISASAAIAKSKLASLSIVDADVSSISESKVTGLVSDLAGKIPATIVDAKGDLIVASAADTVVRVAVGSDNQVLTADSSQASGVKWATPSGGGGTSSDIYPLSAYGFHSASADLNTFTGQSTLDQAFFCRVFVPAGKAINAIGAIVKSAGTVGAGGLNGFAIYDDTGTLVTSTTDDNTMWQSTGWVIKVLGSPIASQGSDRFVYAALASRGYSTPPSVPYNNTDTALTDGGGYLVSNRRCFYNGISTWPASLTPSTYGNSAGGFMPLITLG